MHALPGDWIFVDVFYKSWIFDEIVLDSNDSCSLLLNIGRIVCVNVCVNVYPKKGVTRSLELFLAFLVLWGREHCSHVNIQYERHDAKAAAINQKNNEI